MSDGRPSDAERLFRFRVVEEALRDGKRGSEIMDLLSEKGRKCTWTTVSQYISDVIYKWEMEDAQLRPVWRERQLRKLHNVASLLELRGKWNVWIRVQELIAKIEGNLSPTKIDVSAQDDFEGWSLDELTRYIQNNEIPERLREVWGRSQGSENISRN